MFDNDGTYRTFGLHRLVALAHIQCPGDPDDYEVNHIDFDIENNVASNLEWLTSAQNNMHAALMRGGHSRPALIAVSPEGIPEYLDGLPEATDKFGCSRKDIWVAIRDGSEIDGWRLQYVTTKTPLPIELHKPKFLARDAVGRQPQVPVIFKDTDTGDLIGYASINDAARDHGVSASHLYQCISSAGRPKLFKRRYLIIRDGDTMPVVLPHDLEEMKSPGGKEVIAYNVVDGKYHIFPSASSFIKLHGLSKKAITTTLKKEKLRQIGDWLFVYNKPEFVNELKAIVERPHS
jgi:hypothetical protein